MSIRGKPAGWCRKLGRELPWLRAWHTHHLLPEAESHSRGAAIQDAQPSPALLPFPEGGRDRKERR